MSSEAITRNDLEEILNNIFPQKYPMSLINGLEDRLPVVLYDDDDTPMSQSITLSETSANFEMLIFVCKTNDGHYTSSAVFHPDGKKVDLLDIVVATNANHNIYVKSKTVEISGTYINTTQSGGSYYRTAQMMIGSGTAGTYGDYINITQVIGFRNITTTTL